jgi:hypothetical protein
MVENKMTFDDWWAQYPLRSSNMVGPTWDTAPRAAWTAATASAHDWQPISTAPKDGTHVLVSGPHALPTTVHWFDGAWHLSVNQQGEFSAYVWGEPTHWLALPMRHNV